MAKIYFKLYARQLSTKPFWNRINRRKNKIHPNKIPDIIENEVLLTTKEDKAKAFGRKLVKT